MLSSHLKNMGVLMFGLLLAESLQFDFQGTLSPFVAAAVAVGLASAFIGLLQGLHTPRHHLVRTALFNGFGWFGGELTYAGSKFGWHNLLSEHAATIGAQAVLFMIGSCAGWYIGSNLDNIFAFFDRLQSENEQNKKNP